MNHRSLLGLLIAVAGCNQGGSSPADAAGERPVSLDGPADATPPADRQDAVQMPTTGICPDPGAVACGGVLTGSWQHQELCDFNREPASVTRECSAGPGQDEPACQGAGNLRHCRGVFSGSAEFRADGRLIVDVSLQTHTRYLFTAQCLAAIRREGTARERCSALADTTLSCRYDAEACDCSGMGEPMPVDLGSLDYTVEGGQLTIRAANKTTTGRFCVQGDQVRITFDGPAGFEGWASWLLGR